MILTDSREATYRCLREARELNLRIGINLREIEEKRIFRANFSLAKLIHTVSGINELSRENMIKDGINLS